MDEQLPYLEDIPGIAPRHRGRYNRDQRVLVSMLMVFGLALLLALLIWLF